MTDTNKQLILMAELGKFLTSQEIDYRVDDSSGDHLFYCESDEGNQFTFEVCGEYVEFYSEKTHDTVYYFLENYIEETFDMIKKYVNTV